MPAAAATVRGQRPHDSTSDIARNSHLSICLSIDRSLAVQLAAFGCPVTAKVSTTLRDGLGETVMQLCILYALLVTELR